jgi:hypothetical protein
MGESRLEREQRHLNEDHAARQKESKRTIGLIQSEARINRTTADIEAAATAGSAEPRASSAEFRRLGVEWMVKKTSTMAEIDNNPYLSADLKIAWCGTLQQTTLTDSDDDDLTSLRGKILLEAIKYDPRPGRLNSLMALTNSITTLIETRTQARAEM